MTDERPPCPKCQQAMGPLSPEVNKARWWKCECDRRAYLIRRDGWIVLTYTSD